MAEQSGDRFERHAAVDGLGGQGVAELVGGDPGDPGGFADLAECLLQRGLADLLAVADEEQVAAQAGRSLRDPLVQKCLQLGVQRDVAVVVELAERDAQPVAGADLHDRVHGEGHELAAAHSGAGEELDAQAGEQVGVGSGRGEEPGGCGVVDEAGQRLIADREVPGDDEHPSGKVIAVPLAEPLEAGAQRAQMLGDGVTVQSPAFARRPAGEVQLEPFDVTAPDVGHGGHVGVEVGQEHGEFPQRPLDRLHRRRAQRQTDLVDVGEERAAQLLWDRIPQRLTLGSAVPRSSSQWRVCQIFCVSGRED